jgi:hypothetical protein
MFGGKSTIGVLDTGVPLIRDGQLHSKLSTTGHANVTRFHGAGGNLVAPGSSVFLSEYRGSPAELIGVPFYDSTGQLLARSHEFDHADWTNNGCVITANSDTSPDGNTTADTIEDNGAGAESVQISFTVAQDNNPHCFSVFLKQGTALESSIHLGYSGGTTKNGDATITWGSSPTIDVTDADIDNGGIIPVANGWYRCWIVVSNNNTAGSTTLNVKIFPAGLTGSNTGTVIAWGANLMKDVEFPYMSQISNVASTPVTMRAFTTDLTVMGHNSGEGTFYLEYFFPHTPDSGTNRYFFALSNNTAGECIRFSISTTPQPLLNIRTGSVNVVNIAYSDVGPGWHKAAIRYKTNDCIFAIDGNLTSADTSCAMPTVDRLYVGAGVAGTDPCLGNIKNLIYWPYGMPDGQLQELSA